MFKYLTKKKYWSAHSAELAGFTAAEELNEIFGISDRWKGLVGYNVLAFGLCLTDVTVVLSRGKSLKKMVLLKKCFLINCHDFFNDVVVF